MRTDPTKQQLRWFGLLLLTVFGVVGLVVRSQGGQAAPYVLWGIGGLLATVYYAVPPLRRVMYKSWMHLVYPLGWLISHFLLAGIYFLVVTPLGLLMRLVGRDPLRLRRRDATSHWHRNPPRGAIDRYYQQF